MGEESLGAELSREEGTLGLGSGFLERTWSLGEGGSFACSYGLYAGNSTAADRPGN